jgi:hypothetical protein
MYLGFGKPNRRAGESKMEKELEMEMGLESEME